VINSRRFIAAPKLRTGIVSAEVFH